MPTRTKTGNVGHERINKPTNNADSRSGRGFTLVELLLVIAVIAVLAALLLPALARAKASAKSAACKSNLRQLGIALTMYVSDYQKYPGPIMPEDGGPLEPVGPREGWSGPLNAYLPGEGWPNPNVLLDGGDTRAHRQQCVFTCPAVPRQWQWALPGRPNGGWAYVSSYGYNIKGTGRIPANVQDLGLGPRRVGTHAQYGHPGTILWTAESQVCAPSELIAVGDGYAEGMYNANFLLPEDPWSPQFSYLGTIHTAGANIVFCDGHVEYGKKKQWVKPTEAARKRWNNDNQPHPETWRTSVSP